MNSESTRSPERQRRLSLNHGMAGRFLAHIPTMGRALPKSPPRRAQTASGSRVWCSEGGGKLRPTLWFFLKKVVKVWFCKKSGLYLQSQTRGNSRKWISGCSSARLEYTSGGRVVAGSNPVIPTNRKPWYSIEYRGFFFCCMFLLSPAVDAETTRKVNQIVNQNPSFLSLYTSYLPNHR